MVQNLIDDLYGGEPPKKKIPTEVQAFADEIDVTILSVLQTTAILIANLEDMKRKKFIEYYKVDINGEKVTIIVEPTKTIEHIDLSISINKEN